MKEEIFKEGIIPLLDAFKNFDKNSRNWGYIYNKLEKKFEELRKEVEDKNIKLKNSLQKNLILKNYLLNIIDNIDVCIIILDTKKDIVFLNQFAEKLFKKGMEMLLGKNIKDVLPNWYKQTQLDKIFKIYENIEKEEILFNEFYIQYSNICIFSKSDSEISLENWLGIVQICYDISNVKVDQHRQLIKQKAYSLNQMMANISHEIKNPLLGIFAYLEELNSIEKEKWNNKELSILNEIKKGLVRIDDIIKQGIEFEKFPEPNFLRYDIKKIIQNVINEISTKFDLNKRVIKFNLDLPGNKLFLDIDIYYFEKAFYNILENSVKAIPNNGKIYIIVKYNSWQNTCSIIIKDNGKGIKKDNINYIFDPFFTTYSTNIGLGLTYTKKVIDIHEGTIHIISKEGKGTTVEIKLPIIQDKK